MHLVQMSKKVCGSDIVFIRGGLSHGQIKETERSLAFLPDVNICQFSWVIFVHMYILWQVLTVSGISPCEVKTTEKCLRMKMGMKARRAMVMVLVLPLDREVCSGWVQTLEPGVLKHIFLCYLC